MSLYKNLKIRFSKKKAYINFKRSNFVLDYNTFFELKAKCKRLSKLD